jgi:hypothetical protein
MNSQKAPEIRNCPKCAAVLDGLRVCKVCGYKLRGPKPKVEVSSKKPDLEYSPEVLPKEPARPLIVTLTITIDYNIPAQIEALRKFLDGLF